MADREEMVRRQKLLGSFGATALQSDDLDDVLTEACRLVAEALNADLAKVLEIDRDADEAVVRAGVGWKPGIVGKVRIPLGVRSSEAYAIEVAEPVITQNIQTEERFEFPPFLREHGVIAIVNVPILVPGGEAFGLLQVDAREEREFDEEDIAFLKTYATILGPVIDRLHKVSDLKIALDRNATLLRELQHRVKNDLTVVQSIIRMRSRSASAEAKAELKVVSERIETLRLLHQQLYSGEQVDRLPLGPYVQGLLENLVHLHGHDGGPVELRVDAARMDVSADVAGSVGLILNEFTTNSFKYGFNGEGGRLSVSLQPAGEGKALLTVADNGIGFPQDSSSRRTGTGIAIINSLARQLGGTAQWSVPPKGGVSLHLEFRGG